MRFKVETSKLIHLNEANLNRVVNGHDKSGYVILSSSRQDLWLDDLGNIYDHNKNNSYEKVKINSQLHTDLNNKRYKELQKQVKEHGYSFVPVFGGFKEEGQPKANVEKSLIVYPFNIETKNYTTFGKFVSDMFKLANYFNQDAILVKYNDKNPRYYNPKTGLPSDDYEFKGTSLNDITKEYFTALKKWDDISKKNDFIGGKPQRFTFECYMNDFPKSIAEHRIRSNSGELVRFENYPVN